MPFMRFDRVKIEGRKGGPTDYSLKDCYKKGFNLVLAEITQDYRTYNHNTNQNSLEHNKGN